MSEAVETATVGPFTVRVVYDDHPAMSPREWTNVSRIVAWHRRYDLGDTDTGYNPNDYESAEDLRAAIEADGGKFIAPLYCYEHGGITVSLGSFGDPWDSGQVGWVYATDESIAGAWGADATDEKVREAIEVEVRTYAAYLEGQVYGFEVVAPDGDVLDSCWGFVGEADYCLAEGIEAAKAEAGPLVAFPAYHSWRLATFGV